MSSIVVVDIRHIHSFHGFDTFNDQENGDSPQ